MKLNVACSCGAIPDAVQGVELPSWLLYPTLAPERSQQFGPYSLAVAMDRSVAGPLLGLVVVSHGNNGSPWSHRDTACALVRAGYAVVLLEHIGNSRSDGSLAGSFENLVNRPRHLRLALNWALEHAALAREASALAAFAIGHSIGAYTALAAAGGRPVAYPRAPNEAARLPIPVEPDTRLRALVLLAPATPWFALAGSLRAVEIPILLRAGELDTAAPAFHSELIARGVAHPERVDYRVVPRAGHFSFQSPFPANMVRPDFPPSQDPAGFDRVAYQSVLNSEIVEFFERQRASTK